jgi:hypothetical protein
MSASTRWLVSWAVLFREPYSLNPCRLWPTMSSYRLANCRPSLAFHSTHFGSTGRALVSGGIGGTLKTGAGSGPETAGGCWACVLALCLHAATKIPRGRTNRTVSSFLMEVGE